MGIEQRVEPPVAMTFEDELRDEDEDEDMEDHEEGHEDEEKSLDLEPDVELAVDRKKIEAAEVRNVEESESFAAWSMMVPTRRGSPLTKLDPKLWQIGYTNGSF